MGGVQCSVCMQCAVCSVQCAIVLYTVCSVYVDTKQASTTSKSAGNVKNNFIYHQSGGILEVRQALLLSRHLIVHLKKEANGQ